MAVDLVNELVNFEYVGPKYLNDVPEGMPLYTLEKYSDSLCVISLWRLHKSTSVLNLKKTFMYSDAGDFHYNALSFSAEHYSVQLSDHAVEGSTTFEVSDASMITSGMELFLGPSASSLNPGATEYATVVTVVGNTVRVNSRLRYRHLSGEPVSFCKHLYLFSGVSYGGSSDKGTIYKIDPRTGAIISFDSAGLYSKVSATRWCPYNTCIAAICENNAIFISPYDGYTNWKSMYLSNAVEYDGILSTIQVHDIVFDGAEVYKLTSQICLVDDYGESAIYSWDDTYNFTKTTMLPFTCTVSSQCTNKVLIGQYCRTTVNVHVSDQYGVGLRDVGVRFYMNTEESYDTGAVFDPATAYMVTDANGDVSIDYVSGSAYNGYLSIKCKADKGSPYTGSAYVWSRAHIYTMTSVNPLYYYIPSVAGKSSINYIQPIKDPVKCDVKAYNKTYFNHWNGDVATLQPTFDDTMMYKILQESGKTFENSVIQAADRSVSVYVDSITSSASVYMSQLKMAGHSYWVNGVHSYDLTTNTSANQFIFVEDAIPQFFSHKNNRDTDIWLRLRPSSSSLNADSVRLFISFYSDKLYSANVEKPVSTTYFDAGSGLLGVEVLYTNDVQFDYNSVVRVRIELYDTSYVPNFVYVDYWFNVIQDFNLPYLENISPALESVLTSDDVFISFDVKDAGSGINPESIEVFLNSISVHPDTITRIDDYHYTFSSYIGDKLIYGKDYSVQIIVEDMSGNRLNYRYKFYTAPSDNNLFIDLHPNACDMGLDRFESVKSIILNGGGGVDVGSIRLQVLDKDVTDKSKVTPIIYRIS